MTRSTTKFLAVAALLALGACARQDVARTSKDGARPAGTTERTATGSGTTAANEVMSEMFQRVHQLHQMEVEIGKIGVERASSPKVRDYATKLVRDHQASDERLQNLARERGISMEMPMMEHTSGGGMGGSSHGSMHGSMGEHGEEMRDAKAAMERLRTLRGNQFDVAFMQHMVKDHDKALSMVEGYRTRIQDPAIQQETQQLITMLREHRESAQSILSGLPGGDRKDVRGTERENGASPVPAATPAPRR